MECCCRVAKCMTGKCVLVKISEIDDVSGEQIYVVVALIMLHDHWDVTNWYMYEHWVKFKHCGVVLQLIPSRG